MLILEVQRVVGMFERDPLKDDPPWVGFYVDDRVFSMRGEVVEEKVALSNMDIVLSGVTEWRGTRPKYIGDLTIRMRFPRG